MATWDTQPDPVDAMITSPAAVVYIDLGQTLTNKSIDLSTNVITGTLAQFNTACSNADFATLTGSETLTNKTLTSPTINTPTIATPTITGALIVGTTTNDNATAGNVGEVLTASLAVGSATALTTATAKTIISMSLTAGDWDVTGVIDFKPAATTNTTLLLFGASSTNNTLGADDTYASTVFLTAGQVTTVGDYRRVIPTQRFSLAGTTTIYLVGQATFTVSTQTGYGTIRARRMR